MFGERISSKNCINIFYMLNGDVHFWIAKPNSSVYSNRVGKFINSSYLYQVLILYKAGTLITRLPVLYHSYLDIIYLVIYIYRGPLITVGYLYSSCSFMGCLVNTCSCSLWMLITRNRRGLIQAQSYRLNILPSFARTVRNSKIFKYNRVHSFQHHTVLEVPCASCWLPVVYDPWLRKFHEVV